MLKIVSITAVLGDAGHHPFADDSPVLPNYYPRMTPMESSTVTLGLVQMPAAIIDQLLDGFKVALDHLASLETVQDVRANISRAANRRGVAKGFGGLLDSCHDLLFLDRLSVCQINPCAGQSARADERAGPSAKVFRAKTLAHHFFDVVIDVRPFDIDEFTIPVLILENFLRRMLEQFPNNSGDLAIFQLLMLLDLALASEIEGNQITFKGHVFGPESGNSITAILAGIDLAAGSDEAGGQDAQDAGHYSFAPESGLSQLAGDCLTHVWQGLRKLQQPIKFLPLPAGDVVLVIEILPSAGSVHADGLKQTARRSIDGDIGPGWWNSQSIDPSPIVATGFCVVRGSVTKASPRRSESTNAMLLQSFKLCHSKCAALIWYWIWKHQRFKTYGANLIDHRQILICGSVDHNAVGVESGAMARAIPGLL